jgi:hypothetical protein
MEFFYSHYKTGASPLINNDILDNEYVIIRDKNTDEVLDRLVW